MDVGVCEHGVDIMHWCRECNSVIIEPTNQGRPKENYDENKSLPTTPKVEEISKGFKLGELVIFACGTRKES